MVRKAKLAVWLKLGSMWHPVVEESYYKNDNGTLRFYINSASLRDAKHEFTCNSNIPCGCPCGCSNGLARFARSALVRFARSALVRRSFARSLRTSHGAVEVEEGVSAISQTVKTLHIWVS